MLRATVKSLLRRQQLVPSKAYANYVESGILEPNQEQAECMQHADRLYADLTKLFTGMQDSSIARSQARLVADGDVPDPNKPEAIDDGDRERELIGMVSSSVELSEEQKYAVAVESPGSISEALPEFLIGSKRRMPKRDLLPPPKKHLGLIPVQFLKVEMMREEERRLGLWGSCHPLSDVRGLYIRGGVGSGKSAMLNVIYEELPTPHKKRTHFRQFIDEATSIYEAVFKKHNWEVKDSEPVMNEVAVRLCSSAEVLMLDNVAVQSDEEAVLLRRTFAAMYKTGVCALFTSSVLPEELHASTHKARLAMTPFVSMVRQRCDIIDLGDHTDYRVGAAFGEGGVFLSDGNSRGSKFRQGFLAITDGRIPTPRVVRAYGRDLELDECVEGVCRVSFDELLDTVCPDDNYFDLLARSCNAVFVEDVPQLPATEESVARLGRFNLCLKTMQEHGSKVVMAAEVPIEKLIAPEPERDLLEGAKAGGLLGEGDKKKEEEENAVEAVNSEEPANALAVSVRDELVELAMETAVQLSVMGSREYLRRPHTAKEVTLLDGCPNADELRANLERIEAEERAAGISPETEIEGSALTRDRVKRPHRGT